MVPGLGTVGIEVVAMEPDYHRNSVAVVDAGNSYSCL